MSRLVIVSNRVADLRKSTQTGGLAVGLADALRERGGVWFGWDGDISEAETSAKVESVGNVAMASMPLTQEEYTEYYLGFANSVLWPLFHYRLDLVAYRPEFLERYHAVNQRFATQLLPLLRPDDTIWIHDYHLIPLAHHLREMGCTQRIGFFLHIPFPPPDILVAAPGHGELVDWLLEYDLVGTQTQADANNLMRYFEEVMGLRAGADGRWTAHGHDMLVQPFPIGIDVDGFVRMAAEAPEDVAFDIMRRQVLGNHQIIGVDRLDYSKGLPQRMKSYGLLLEQHPELERKVSFLQIAPTTREDVTAYADIRTELETLAGSINGRFADFNWTPIRYIRRQVPREKLAPLFRGSRVGFVTPLRDGMNLVAKEYIAAQDPEDPGVLVLSQFAGAAEELSEALLVNPYDLEDMARRLHEALVMSPEERRERHAALFAKIRRNDVRGWMNEFLLALAGMRDGRQGLASQLA